VNQTSYERIAVKVYYYVKEIHKK